MAQTPHPVDVHVGRRLKQRRRLLGLSQERLGGILGLTFQQIQKYERGTNRLGASRLFTTAEALGVSVEYFFDGYGTDSEGLAESQLAYETGLLTATDRRDTLELIRAYDRIKDSALRRAILDVARSVADFEGSIQDREV